MGMQFLIRKTQLDSPFQRALCQLLETEGDSLYISSGYVSKSILLQNNGKRVQFTDNHNNTYSFLDSLDKGFIGTTNPRITIIGGMYKRYDQNLRQEVPDIYQQSKFNEFLKGLKSQVTVNTFDFQKAINDHWHSKIALKVNNGEPVAAIVGSSNLSFYSFGTRSWSGFNHESDIYIYKGVNGIKDIKYEVSLLKDKRIKLIKEFISIIMDSNITICDEEEIHERLYSNRLEDSKNIVDRMYSQEKLIPQWENMQFILFTIKQYNQMISATKQAIAPTHSVITVTPNIPVEQILNDIYTTLQHAIVAYTTQITPDINGDYI